MAQNLKKKKKLPLVFSLLISSSFSLPSFLPLFQKKIIKGDKEKCFVVIVRKDIKNAPSYVSLMLFGSSMWPQSTPAGCEGRPRRRNRQDTGSTCRNWVAGTLQPRLRLRDMIPIIPEHIFLWVGRIVSSLDFTFLRNGLLKSAFFSQGFIPTVFSAFKQKPVYTRLRPAFKYM